MKKIRHVTKADSVLQEPVNVDAERLMVIVRLVKQPQFVDELIMRLRRR